MSCEHCQGTYGIEVSEGDCNVYSDRATPTLSGKSAKRFLKQINTQTEPKLTFSGTFEIRKVANILKNYKQGDIDESQVIMNIIENAQTPANEKGICVNNKSSISTIHLQETSNHKIKDGRIVCKGHCCSLHDLEVKDILLYLELNFKGDKYG
jgi:hypothetical protein